MSNAITGFIKDNLGAIGAGVGGAALGAAVGYAAGKRSNSTKRKKSSKRKSGKRYGNRAKKRTRKTPRTAGKGKDTSHRRIRHTKTGQPYIILASGKARFIKKSSARNARKRQGGRY